MTLFFWSLSFLEYEGVNFGGEQGIRNGVKMLSSNYMVKGNRIVFENRTSFQIFGATG